MSGGQGLPQLLLVPCLLRPLWDVAGPAIVDDLRLVPYAEASMGGTPARYLDLVPALPDPVIRALVGAHGRLRHGVQNLVAEEIAS